MDPNIKQPESCFVCSRNVQGKGVLLSVEKTVHSKTPMLTKLMQLLGDAFMVVILQDDKICSRCVNLMNQSDKLELDLRVTQNVIKGFLNEKYHLNEEIGSTYSQDFKSVEDHFAFRKESLPLSLNDGVSIRNEVFKPIDSLEKNEEISVNSLISENVCEVIIKSEPMVNYDQCLSSKVTDPETLLSLPDDLVHSIRNRSTDSDGSKVKEIVEKCKDFEALQITTVKHTLVQDQNVEPSLCNEIKDSAVTTQLSEVVPTNKNKSEIKSFFEVSDVSCTESIPTSNSSNSELVKKKAYKESVEKLSKNTANKRSSVRNSSTASSDLKNQRKLKLKRKDIVYDGGRKLKPILPKIPNIKEILSSLYVIEGVDNKSISTEELVKDQKYLSIKTEFPDIKKLKEIEALVKGEKFNSTQKVPTESGCINSINEIIVTGDLKTKPKCISASKENEKEQAQLRYHCSFCPKSFKLRKSKRNHEASHTGNYTQYCEFCGLGFATLHRLKDHRRKHTREECYVCDVCGKKFNFSGTLWIHRKWHDNPYPYKCEICGEPFKHSSRLAIHRRKHKGERPFKCPHCSLTFDVKSSYKRHLIIHTKQYPYNCIACNKGFTTRTKYLDHLARKHDTYVERVPVDPKDYKVVVVHNSPKEEMDLDTEKAKDIEFGESISQSPNNVISEIVVDSSLSDCQIELILPPSVLDNTDENSFPNISWLA